MTIEQTKSPATTPRRRAMTADEQCDVMARHGITFQQCSREAAKQFLQDNTYFFKLKAFDKNFQRDADGQYQNLDFAYLRDLSTIDFELRILILRMTGDIEHALRVRFNNLISRVDEDGYQVIRDYEQDQMAFYESQGKHYNPESVYQKSVYTKGMIDKYLVDKPIWLFWETCSLNSLIHCYRSFLKHRQFQDITYSLLYGVRLLRNAASHHNCLLLPPSEQIKPTRDLNELLKLLLNGKTEFVEQTLHLAETDALIHDFSCVLLAHCNLVKSSAMRAHITRQIENFCDRMKLHEDWYRNPSSGCNHLIEQMDAMQLLMSCVVELNQKRGNESLPEAQMPLLRQPYRRPVRHGRRQASKQARLSKD
ncbi:Abi family protein [Bifidobacterium oedipodis]|uniref:CAAX amino protease n=1 Tax=Bifidobacterium oedipodis TaxID=2675322 RepID=A0A7Y0ERG3_9BIFI|nr:Abi family protein [Bifidobacterium sp. DSM 109957]NMM95076.1 CAAX amino protease [Bifidobacterium sp. DSM 109957]